METTNAPNTDQPSPVHNKSASETKDDEDTCCKHLLDSYSREDLNLPIPSPIMSSDTCTQPLDMHNPQYHHRRKRIRISPLTRDSGDSQRPVERDVNQLGCCYPTINVDADANPVAKSDLLCPPESMTGQNTLVENPNEISNTATTYPDLDMCKMDPEVESIVLKYVRLKSVIRCLELAGYCTPFVMACLDEVQIQRLEEFIGHTCSFIESSAVRERFLGPIFAKYPDQFRLPAGAVCGLLLAAADVKRRYRRVFTTQLVTPNCIPPLDFNPTEEFFADQGFADVASQTDASVPFIASKSSQALSDLDVSTTTPVTSSSTIISRSVASLSHSLPSNASDPTSQDDNSQTTKAAPLIDQPTTPNTVAMMAAAFQAAAVAASGNSYPQGLSKSSSMFTSSCSNHVGNHLVSKSSLNPINGAFPSDPSTVISNVQNAARLVAAVSGCTMPNSLQSLPSVVISGNGNGLGLMHDEEVIDLERLKQHSSASAIRLASRQFVNAHLVRGRDFDMEMEISVTPEGLKRVTGIFYCHLCREKRERTSAVRFSIARNRYPVLSNVLSHLKTHFQYRGQLFHMQPNTPQLFPQIKSPYSSGDPFLNFSPAAIPSSGSSSASINPLGIIGLSSNSASYADITTELSALSSGGGLFLNPSTCVSQSSPMIKGEAVDCRTDSRIPDETGTNSSSSDTRASVNSEPSLSPTRTASLNNNLMPRDSTPPTLTEPSESNGLSLDLFPSQTSNINTIFPK